MSAEQVPWEPEKHGCLAFGFAGEVHIDDDGLRSAYDMSNKCRRVCIAGHHLCERHARTRLDAHRAEAVRMAHQRLSGDSINVLILADLVERWDRLDRALRGEAVAYPEGQLGPNGWNTVDASHPGIRKEAA